MSERRAWGTAKHRPQLAVRIGQEQKSLIERTAEYLNVSQAIAVDMLLERVPTTPGGIPEWAVEMKPEEGTLPYEKTA